MDVAMEDMGKTRELELFDALKDVFGKECVYYSPKYRKECGEEKELSDILILALPYAISIQMKWLSVDDEDFESEKGEVIEKRVIRRMEKAAKQHTSFFSDLLIQAASFVKPGLISILTCLSTMNLLILQMIDIKKAFSLVTDITPALTYL